MNLFGMTFFDDKSGKITTFEDYLIQLSASKLQVKDFAIQKSAGMIASVIAKSEFQVYRKVKGKLKSVKDDTYYMLNVRPNPNEDGTTFWKNVVMRLLTAGESLIITDAVGDIYLADTGFIKSTVVNYPKTFTNVSVDNGNLRYDRTFSMNDVVYLTLGENKITDCLNNFYSEIGAMLGFAASDYKEKNSTKYMAHVPMQSAVVSEETGKKLKSQDYADMVGATLNREDLKVLSLDAGVTLDKLSGGENKTSQDFRDMLKVAMDYVAIGYNIPLDLFYGNKTDKSTTTSDFITFACEPIFEIIEDGSNAKWVTKKEYLSGSKIKIDKSRIQHVDFFETADAEYKLLGSGYSPNDIRIAKGLEPIDEDWANEHYITKNNEKGGTTK